MTLSKEQFLAPKQRKVEPVDLPDSGGKVYVRKLFTTEQIDLEAESGVLDDGDTKGFIAVRLAFFLCTESGEPFITIAEAREHIKGQQYPGDTAAIMRKGIELNPGISAQAIEATKGN